MHFIFEMASIMHPKGRKDMFYLMTYSTHFVFNYMALDIWKKTTVSD